MCPRCDAQMTVKYILIEYRRFSGYRLHQMLSFLTSIPPSDRSSSVLGDSLRIITSLSFYLSLSLTFLFLSFLSSVLTPSLFLHSSSSFSLSLLFPRAFFPHFSIFLFSYLYISLTFPFFYYALYSSSLSFFVSFFSFCGRREPSDYVSFFQGSQKTAVPYT